MEKIKLTPELEKAMKEKIHWMESVGIKSPNYFLIELCGILFISPQDPHLDGKDGRPLLIDPIEVFDVRKN